jgi:hypothetical protein
VNCCQIEVGDDVDWKDIFNPRQGAWWHGVVLQDLGVGKLGPNQRRHKFLIRWTLASKWSRFKKLPEGTWVTPIRNSHQQVELCSELVHCLGTLPLYPPNLS